VEVKNVEFIDIVESRKIGCQADSHTNRQPTHFNSVDRVHGWRIAGRSDYANSTSPLRQFNAIVQGDFTHSTMVR
jgi:hypothetical protein